QKKKQLESRVRVLEEELEATRGRVRQEQEEAKARVQQIESERNHLAASLAAKQTEYNHLAAELAAKEEELLAASAPPTGTPERVQELEAELNRLREIESERDQLAANLAAASDRLRELQATLAEWKARAASEPRAEAHAPHEAVSAGSGADAGRVSDFYQQTMSRLTVILAYADLLAMNPRVDSSIQDTAREIRSEGQLLSQIIKGFTLPPDTRPAE
ncbi:MAG TPA: hypothetical protein VIG89_03700, partial [Candidatus Acidoferrales bacterium]